MRRIQLAILAAALVGASSASASLTVIIDAPNPSQIVDLVVTPAAGSSVPAFSGDVYAGIYNETIDGVFTPSFCIDVAHDVTVGEEFTDYSYAALPDAPDTPAGPMGAGIAIDIEKLWAQYYTAAQSDSSGVMAAALQVAIWEVEGGGQLLGNGNPGYTVTASGNDSVTTETASMLASLSGLTAEADLEAIVSPDGQSYVVAVPEVSTVIAGALLLLPFAACTFKIVRKHRRS
ncbi:MAG: hypothetical protein WBS33_05425 [Verrucomicrobiia bacterium]